MAMRAGATGMCSIAVSLAVLLGFADGTAIAEQLTIGPSGAYLRAAPSDRAFTVLSMRAGQTVTVLDDSQPAWIGISAPQNAAAWVYGDLVRNDRVIAPRMLVRAGPGIDYEGVGEITKGARVTVRGRQDDWLKIAPPEGVMLWLKRGEVASPVDDPGAKPLDEPVIETPTVAPVEIVSSPEPPAPQQPLAVSPPEPPAPVRPTQGVRTSPVTARRQAGRSPVRSQAQAPSVERPAVSEPAPEEMAGTVDDGESLAVPQGAVKGRDVTVTGQVKRAPLFPRERYSDYRLVRRNAKGQRVTVCYLLGSEKRLAALVGHSVKVSGVEYRVPGQRYPALALSAIEPVQ